MKFLVDEDLPISLAIELASAGFDVSDVRRIGLRGRSDTDILLHALSAGMILITADVDFAGVVGRTIGTIPGCILVRLPNEISVKSLCEIVVKALTSVSNDELKGNVLVIEPDRIRLRRR